MNNTLLCSQWLDIVDEFLSEMKSLGYRDSTIKVTKENILLFLKNIPESDSITEETIQHFVERYNKITQRSRYNSVLNSCRKFYCYISCGMIPLGKPKNDYSYDLSIEKIKLREDFLLNGVSTNNEKTIEKKRRCITKFLAEFPITFSNIDNYQILLEFISTKTPEDKAYIRSFLHYLK